MNNIKKEQLKKDNSKEVKKKNFYQQLKVELETCEENDLLTNKEMNDIHKILDRKITLMIKGRLDKVSQQ